MRIAFITSCLEPGRDGVGDYTRLLAEECVRQGHECCLISLNDRLLTQLSQSRIAVDGVKIPMLRLPANMPWNYRNASIKELLASFKPEWVSLQFVPYGFQDKGITIGLSKWLRPLVQGRRMHMMFHELWIGQYVGAAPKDRLIGFVQKFVILRLVKQLQPSIIHTSNSVYIRMLQQLGISARHLPLFGAIPIGDKNGDDWLFPELQKLGLDVQTGNRSQFWLFGFFGTLHPIWPAEPLFTYLHQAGIQHQRRIAIISIGCLGAGEQLWESLSKTYSCQFVFLRLGEQLPTKISEFFNSIDFSIATSCYLLIGKSATVAAMLEHGLPVIVNRDDIQLSLGLTIPQDYEPLLYKMDSRLPDKVKNSLQRQAIRPRLKSTTIKFINELTDSSSFGKT